MTKTDKRIADDILLYGGNIIRSALFKDAAREEHHIHGSVSEHSLNVCILSIKLSNLLSGSRSPVIKEDLIKAALCHDLGMVGRSAKYGTRMDSWKGHPADSADIAKHLFPEISENAENSIRTHMWPLIPGRPSSKEARILTIADKAASVADWLPYLFNQDYKYSLKRALILS